MEMLLFTGIQASGKSTFYRERFFDTHLRISLDLLKTRHRESAFIQLCCATGQRFVVDNTNVTRAERTAYIEAAKRSGFRVIGYLFEPDPQGAFERNRSREKKHVVPAAGLFGTLKRLERPQHNEGFDELYRVWTRPGSFETERLI